MADADQLEKRDPFWDQPPDVRHDADAPDLAQDPEPSPPCVVCGTPCGPRGVMAQIIEAPGYVRDFHYHDRTVQPGDLVCYLHAIADGPTDEPDQPPKWRPVKLVVDAAGLPQEEPPGDDQGGGQDQAG